MVPLVFPFKLRKSRMNQRFGNAAIVKDRGLKQVINSGLGPATSFGNLGSNVSHAFAVVNVGNPHEVQGVRQRVNGLMKI